MAQRSNLAVDLSRYEEREERVKARQENRKKITVSEEAPASNLFTIVMGVFVAIFAFIAFTQVVNSNAGIAAIDAKIQDQQVRVESLLQENRRMKTELEQKSSQKNVETYAEDVLGMQKLDKSQIEYISLESGNVAEIPDHGDGILRRISHAFDDLVAFLKGE